MLPEQSINKKSSSKKDLILREDEAIREYDILKRLTKSKDTLNLPNR